MADISQHACPAPAVACYLFDPFAKSLHDRIARRTEIRQLYRRADSPLPALGPALLARHGLLHMDEAVLGEPVLRVADTGLDGGDGHFR